MSMRNTSGKFSIPFGRKSDKTPASPTGTGPTHGRFFSGSGDDDFGPGGQTGGSGSGGLNLGKRIAHQSLIPGLGNQELRQLQDVISTEKNVLTATEKLSSETSKAAAALPAFGTAEGPDLQDILTQSSNLLNHLSTALTVFAGHQANMRVSYKRIREREETLDELRRRRRSTGAKSESAEKKLAKMGPENKSLPGQTDLLEKLRQEMRSMDTEIVMEESKLGDFKRQMLKEALSLKFGGMEELGEKMCIIGELGKLLLEEIPLEETPPGYGRAPYNGYEKTANATNEAARCLAGVEFHAAGNAPKPPGLPHHQETAPLTTPTLQTDRVTAAEEFANYPGNVASPEAKGKNRDTAYGLDENPYGGYEADPNRATMYGGQRQDSYGNDSQGGNQVVWQGPTEEAMHAHTQRQQERQQNGRYQSEQGHDYEYDQQRQMDADAAAWRETPAHNQAEQTFAPIAEHQNGDLHSPPATANSWEPLSVKRGQTPIPETNGDSTTSPHLASSSGLTSTNPLGAPVELAPPMDDRANAPSPSELSELAPPNPAFMNDAGRATTPHDGFYTPMGDLDVDPINQLERLEQMEKDYVIPPSSSTEFPSSSSVPPPAPIPVPTGRDSPAPMTPTSPTSASMFSGAGHRTTSSTGGGKISAAAFRRGAKPRMSGDEEGVRRLPVPPPSSSIAEGSGGSVVPPTIVQTLPSGEVGQPTHAQVTGDEGTEEGHGAYSDARMESDPPPVYAGESLR